MSHEVVTPWYRCPELLLGTRHYGPEIDMWSVGCVFGEMMDTEHKPLFPGNGDANQLELIYQTCGSPQDGLLDRFRQLPNWETLSTAIPRTYPNNFQRKFGTNPMYSPQALQLLAGLIEMDPSKRLSAQTALLLDYFYRDVAPEPHLLPRFQVASAFSMTEIDRMNAERKAADAERWRQSEEKAKQRAEERQLRESQLAHAQQSGRGGFHLHGRGHHHQGGGHHGHGHHTQGQGGHHGGGRGGGPPHGGGRGGRGPGQLQESKIQIVKPIKPNRPSN
jgi:cyclin-dependent kinase 12/13